jgi:hypothetical protein
VDWAAWPDSLFDSDGRLAEQVARWQEEYAANIRRLPEPAHPFGVVALNDSDQADAWWDTLPWSKELDGIRYQPAQEDTKNELHPARRVP